jgi:SAM-dependent methyltransferase
VPCIIGMVPVDSPPSLRAVLRAKLLAPTIIRRAVKSATRVVRIGRHLLFFTVPDERSHCPVCTAPSPRPMLPIPLEGRSRTFGFASACERCGVLFANPFPSADETATAYSPEGVWGRHRQEEQEKQVSRLRLERIFEPVAASFDVLKPPPGASVLDFGCGLGGMLDGLAALGWNTSGIEPAMKGAFDRHRELTEIPSTATFDLAVLHNVLEHVTDPLTILRRLAGAVREGGYLLISVPNLDKVAVHGEMKYCIRAGVHVLAYTQACIRWLAADAGFEVVSDRSEVSSRQRHLIVIAQRRAVMVAKPVHPVRDVDRAIASYAAVHRTPVAQRFLPVRVQAAFLDLQRSRWRV